MTGTRFATTQQLRARGYTVERIREEIGANRLERVVKGWYAFPGTDRQAIRAMRLGGRLGCVSALRVYGAWCPPDEPMHLMLPSHASGRRFIARAGTDEAVKHWHGKTDATGSAFALAPMSLAVEQLLDCQPPRFAVAVLDSLAHRGLMHPNRIRALIAAGPQRTRELGEHLEPRSEEGIESLVRFALRSHGIDCSVQVVLVEEHRVDLLIDGWLVLEVDGRNTHAVAGAFTRDRVRAGKLFRNGRIVLQFAYATVVYDIEFVIDTVRAVLDQHTPVR